MDGEKGRGRWYGRDRRYYDAGWIRAVEVTSGKEIVVCTATRWPCGEKSRGWVGV